MLRMEIDNTERVVVDYQMGAVVTRTVDLATEGLPITVDLDINGNVVSVNLEAEGYDRRPVRLLVREG